MYVERAIDHCHPFLLKILSPAKLIEGFKYPNQTDYVYIFVLSVHMLCLSITPTCSHQDVAFSCGPAGKHDRGEHKKNSILKTPALAVS